MAKSVFARRSFDYGPVTLDLGQVTDVKGLRNDEKLLRLGYLVSVEPGISLVGCGRCGARFVSDAFLNMHGRKRHEGLTLEEQDQELARQEKVYEGLPLNVGAPVEVKTVKRGPGRPRKDRVSA